MTTRARDFKFPGETVVGNGHLNSKMIVGAIGLVLLWTITHVTIHDKTITALKVKANIANYNL